MWTSTNADDRPLLEVQNIYAGYYTGQDILKGVTLEVHSGEIVCVIGPNGAGKSTVFKAIYGIIPVRSGRVLCDGREITNIPPEQALKTAGITIVPQLRSVFSQMTVHENLELGMYPVQRQSEDSGTDRIRLRSLPPTRRAEQARGRHDVGR